MLTRLDTATVQYHTSKTLLEVPKHLGVRHNPHRGPTALHAGSADAPSRVASNIYAAVCSCQECCSCYLCGHSSCSGCCIWEWCCWHCGYCVRRCCCYCCCCCSQTYSTCQQQQDPKGPGQVTIG